MPNPVPLATKEEEERRAWVTAHHEVVRLVKDCFGDRFSNNEIFDRLKISRRTGYRALGNDDRIGKAPGRKPKILDSTVKEMIEYIESGGCSDVGNVWKHLADKYAPNCNPKTVQDAVKKSGFRNYHSSVKLEPLLNEQLPDGGAPGADDEGDPTDHQLQEDAAAAQQRAQQVDQAQQAERAHREQQAQQQHHHHHHQQQQQQQSVFDPALQHQTPQDYLRHVIATFPQDFVRYVLNDLVGRNQEAMILAHHHFSSAPYAVQHSNTAPMAQLAVSTQPNLNALQVSPLATPHAQGTKRRVATCRRCGLQFDRAENKMENRECLYHKGSPQKIDPDAPGTIAQLPEAYIWSCCGGNGNVRGCCRAMHTTKKRRKTSSRKRSAAEAGFDDSGVGGGAADGDDDGVGGGASGLDDDDDDEATAAALGKHSDGLLDQHHRAGLVDVNAPALHGYHPAFSTHLGADPNIDSSLQDGHSGAPTPGAHAQQQHQQAATAAETAQSALHPSLAMSLDHGHRAPNADTAPHAHGHDAQDPGEQENGGNVSDGGMGSDLRARLQAAAAAGDAHGEGG